MDNSNGNDYGNKMQFFYNEIYLTAGFHYYIVYLPISTQLCS